MNSIKSHAAWAMRLRKNSAKGALDRALVRLSTKPYASTHDVVDGCLNDYLSVMVVDEMVIVCEALVGHFARVILYAMDSESLRQGELYHMIAMQVVVHERSQRWNTSEVFHDLVYTIKRHTRSRCLRVP